jgi:hypothetical protein
MLESLGVRQGLHGPAFLLPFFSSLALDLRKIWFKIVFWFCPETLEQMKDMVKG